MIFSTSDLLAYPVKDADSFTVLISHMPFLTGEVVDD
jgi:hypothetical protein